MTDAEIEALAKALWVMARGDQMPWASKAYQPEKDQMRAHARRLPGLVRHYGFIIELEEIPF